MIWWIDFSLNVILTVYFGFYSIQLLVIKKPAILSSTVYCSMLILGIFSLVFPDLINTGFSFQYPWYLQWKVILFFLGLVLYLSLIPRMIREFYILHLSETQYRSIVGEYFKDKPFSLRVINQVLKIDSEANSGTQTFFQPALKYCVWFFPYSIQAMLEARRMIGKSIKKQQRFSFFSWYGLFFLLMTILLTLRLFAFFSATFGLI